MDAQAEPTHCPGGQVAGRESCITTPSPSLTINTSSTRDPHLSIYLRKNLYFYINFHRICMVIIYKNCSDLLSVIMIKIYMYKNCIDGHNIRIA